MRKLILLVAFILALPTEKSAQLQFADRVQISRSTAEVGVADFDMDGYPDIAISSGSQRWYAGPEFTTWHYIGDSDGGPYAARVADVDGDGWVDLVTSDGTRNPDDMPGNIYLYLNPGEGQDVTQPWTRIVVYTGQVRHQNDLRIIDMDGDGLLDIIERTWSSERVVVSLQNADINTWTTRAFDTGETGKPEGISAGDIDGDGENEIVLSGVYWDNPGGWRTGDPIEYSIDTEFLQEEVKSAVGDIDNDGDNDVYMGSCEGNYKYLAWYENTGDDGTGGTNFVKHIIKDNTGKYHMVELIDIDFDGDLDLATGKSFGDDGCVIFYNENGGATWTESVYDPNGNLYTGVVADLDADGDYDIVGPDRFNDPVYYYINETPGSPPEAPANLIANLVDGIMIDLTWSDLSEDEGTFELEVNDGTSWVPLHTAPANSTTYLHTTASPATDYQYRIRSANAAGVSAWDSSQIVTTWTQLTTVNIDPIGDNYVLPPTITLQDLSGLAEEIRYTTDGTSPDLSSTLYTAPVTLQESATIKASSFATGYLDSPENTEFYNIAINGNFPPLADAGADQSQFDFSLVTLDGSMSTDIDDDISVLSFMWSPVAGPSKTLDDPTSQTPTFTPITAGEYSIELVVSDEAQSSRDTVVINVNELSENLIAYWPLDESSGNIASEIINNIDATTNSGTSWSPGQGKIDGALVFNGATGRAESASVNVPGSEMTITMWIKVPNYDEVEGRILSKANGTNANDHVWMVSQNGGSALRYRLNTGGATTTLISNTGEIPIDEWIFVTARYDGSTMKLFKNSVEIASTAQSGDIQQTAANIAIGNQPTGAGDRPFSGTIDDVRLYDIALSQQDIEDLYNDACANYILLKDVTIDADASYIAKDEIELENVIVPSSFSLSLKAKKITIDNSTQVQSGSSLIIKYGDGCND